MASSLANSFQSVMDSLHDNGSLGATYNIVPAHDPRVDCHFTIPRSNGEPIEFTVKRLPFLDRSYAQKYQDWLEQRSAAVNAWNTYEAKVAAGETDDLEPVEEASPVTGRELILKQLSLTIPAAVYRKLEKLTDGELEQIAVAWMEASDLSQAQK